MAKTTSRRTLKSLFSRSEVSLAESVEKNTKEDEKTKFRFLKFKKKTKRDPAPVKGANEIQQTLSAAEPSDLEDLEVLDDIISAGNTSSNYGTTSRSKGKEFSYSELDLRKPKRFASFSFGFKTKKRNDQGNISQSTIGLNGTGIKEQEETPPNHRQNIFCMPQPELEAIDTFDISSPPAVATNQSESYLPFLNQSQSSYAVSAQPEAPERLKNGSNLFDVHAEPLKAPIAAIPELQLDNPESSEEKGDGDDDFAPSASATCAETSPAADNPTVPSLPASRPPPALDTSDRTAAVVNSVAASAGPCDNDTLTNTEISHTGSTRVTLSSHHQADDGQNGELSRASAGSKKDGAVAQSTAVPHADLDSDSASVHPEVSISRTERSAPVTGGGAEKGAVYGALYESLFPQNFNSGVMSYPSNPPPHIITEIRHLDSKSEPVMVKTLNERYTEPVPYSEPTRCLSEVKSDSFSLIQDNVRSVPAVQSSAPPVSEYVTSQGGDTRVTHSKRRAILVKELVTDEASTDPIYPSLVPEKMSAAKGLEVRIETMETFFSPSGQADWADGPLSPAYLNLSVGSDDSSAAEIYYSAEEDNEGGSGKEEMHTVDERVESCVVDGGREECPQQAEVAERGIRKRKEGEFMVVIIERQNEEVIIANEEEKEDVNNQGGQRSGTPVQETETSDFLVGTDAESREKEVATAVLPQVGDKRAEELPATPVQQVGKPAVCDFAPPSSESQGEGEGSDGNLTDELETEDHPNGEAALPIQEAQYLAHMHTASSSTGDKLTPRPSVSVEQVSPAAEAARTGEASPDATETGSDTAVTATSITLQSDATEVEHNRAASTKWVDTVTQSAERTATAQEQAAANADTSLPDPEAEGTPSDRHPSEAQPDPNQGSLTASRTQPTAASEGFASVDQPPQVEKGSVDEMNSGYSTLSTKLSIKNSSPPKEDESKYRFRKVSLINEATEVSQDKVDFSQDGTAVPESNGTDESPDYRWRNRFEGVSQYRIYNTESSSFSDSLSYNKSDSYSGPPSSSSSSSGTHSSSSSSSALPDSTADKHLSNSSSSYPEEHVAIGNRLSDMTKVSLSYESEPVGAPKDEWRRSLLEWEEPAAPAGEREAEAEVEAEAERFESGLDSHRLPLSGISSAQSYDAIDTFEGGGDDDSSCFTGLFKATLVDLVSEPAAPSSTPPDSPDADCPIQFDMDSLVDTLKNMGPSLRPRSLRGAPPVMGYSLPPIVEDASSPVTSNTPAESLKGLYTLPVDLGLKRSSLRETPLELMMKQNQEQQQQPGTRGLNLPQRSSVANSLLRRSSDSSAEELKSPVMNGNGPLPSYSPGSRLDNSVLFRSHRSASTDQTSENGQTYRPLFRASSLPDKGSSKDRMSSGKKELGEPGSGTDMAGFRFDRFSFLLNSAPSPSSSLTGIESSNSRISRPPAQAVSTPPSTSSPTHLLNPTIDLQRPLISTDSAVNMFSPTMGIGAGPPSLPILQRSFSNEGPVGVQQISLFNSRLGGSQFQSQEHEPEKNLESKYRAFPDAYLTKAKEHGKLNPRPGKMYIFDRPGMCGQRIEVHSDVIDATPWELQETISIRVIRGGWVLYEKPNFKGEKIALDEGDIELTYPFDLEEQLQNGEQEAGEQNGGTSDVPTKPVRRFIIGSLRRAVRDYSVPEISLFPEENAEGKKVTFRDTSEDARIFGFPIKANSIIINAGLWLVYAHPFFQGLPRVLEVGGFSNPAAWGVEQPYVGSLHPLKVGEPRVENMSEPKMVIYDKPYFTGKSRTISTSMRDFMTKVDRQQSAFMYSIGSLKVLGGIWVGYEKEGFRGHQYLLEEGQYQDWRVWGSCNAELRSVRLIRADLTDPTMVMFEQPEEEHEGLEDENTFEVTEAIPDVELFEYRTSTRSIHVISGAWIAYSHVDYSGDQYILEKGFYNNYADWGSQDTRICSVQPIRLAPSDSSRTMAEVILYPEPDFQGECHVFKHNQEELPEKLQTKSCRVSGASWVLYETKQHSGNLYVLSEGDYPNLTSMGCPPVCNIRSVKVVPMTLSVPSISLFGLECLEGREITMDTETPSMVEEGFNNHILSIRVNSGCWVICEHGNYRGRQFLLEPIEITNWPKFSSIQTIGSMFPVRQKRRFLRIKNKERGHFLSVQGGVEEMKSGRVVVTPEVEPMSDIWFYQDGFIKSKLSPTMSLQVMGTIEPAAKVVLWAETRQPVQTWKAQMSGLISSLNFPGCVLDVKGGKTYDKDHVVIMPENEERPSQKWEIELL